MNFHIVYTSTRTGNCNMNRARRGSIAGAANVLHRINSAKHRQLVSFTIDDVEYDMPWMRTRNEVIQRLEDITDFHESFYKGIP